MIFKDRAKETTTSVGTGDLTLDGASSGYQALPASLSQDFYYCIVHTSANEWEVGIGNASSGSLVRGSVLDGTSGAGVAVDFSAGTKDVFCTVPARLFDLFMGNNPTGVSTLTTEDNTPTDITVALEPIPPMSGGLRYMFVRYKVAAYTTSGGVNMKVWDGSVFYRGATGSTDAPVVIHDPETTGWAISAAVVDGELVVTVTGHASKNTYWKVSATAEISAEIGV